MKISTSIYLSLILSVSLISNVDAAKENFNRSKSQVRAVNGLDNVCSSKKGTKVCSPQQLASDPRCNPSTRSTLNDPTPIYMTINDKATQSSTCVKPGIQAPSSLTSSSTATQSNLQSGGTRATSYVSSRSNKSYGTNAMNDNSSLSNTRVDYQDGDDLVLRKRPGRTKFNPPGDCPSLNMSEKSQTKPRC